MRPVQEEEWNKQRKKKKKKKKKKSEKRNYYKGRVDASVSVGGNLGECAHRGTFYAPSRGLLTEGILIDL